MNNMAIAVALAVSVVSIGLQAEQLNWTKVDESYSGLFTDTAHWGGAAHYPGEWDASESHMGDVARIDAWYFSPEATDWVISYPEGVVTNFAGIYATIKGNRALTVDGRKSVLVMPKPTKGGSIVAPLNVAAGASDSYWLMNFDTNGQGENLAGGTYSNFLYRMSTTNAVRRFDFLEGDYRLMSGQYLLVFRGNSVSAATMDNALVCVHPNAKVHVPCMLALYPSAVTNRFVVDGSTLEADTTVWMSGTPYQGSTMTADETHYVGLEAVNGAVLNLKGSNVDVCFGRRQVSGNYVSRLLVDGSRLYANSRFSTDGDGRHVIDIVNGSVAVLNAEFAMGNCAGAEATITYADSIVTNLNTVTLGGTTAEMIAGGACAKMDVSNARLCLRNKMTVYSGDVYLRDGAVVELTSQSYTPKACLVGDMTLGGEKNLHVDGARFVCYPGAEMTISPIEGFTAAAIGAKGFTVESARPVTIAQTFCDEDGESGVLCLTGAGAKTLSGASTVSRIVVDGGAVAFTGGVGSTVVVTNGNRVSFGGSATAEHPLGGLVLGDAASAGVLEVRPNETISVDSAPVLGCVRFALADGFAIGDKVTIAAKGTLSAASAAAWTRAQVVEGLPPGAGWETSVEDVNGGQVLTLTLVDGAPIVIAVESGTETRETNITFGAGRTLETAVAKDARAELSGDLAYGRFAKTGGGATELSGENAFVGGIAVDGGLLSATTLAALGVDPLSAVSTLADGTLEMKSGGVLDAAFDINASKGANALVVIKNEADVTMPIPSATQGAIVKRGKGRLTFEVAGDTDWGGLQQNGLKNMASGETMVFDDANGTAPGTDKHYAAVNVAEGELRFRGTGMTPPKVSLGGAYDALKGTVVGLASAPAPENPAQPGLVLDNVEYDLVTGHCGGGYDLMLTFNFAAEYDSFITAPYLYVTNGASLKANFLGLTFSNKDTQARARLYMDNGTIQTFYEMHLAENYSSANVTNEIVMRNGSALYATYDKGRLILGGCRPVFDVDSSTIARDPEGAPLGMFFTDRVGSGVDMTFRNGSYFGCYMIGMNGDGKDYPQTSKYPNYPIRMSFDDSEWYCGAGNRDMPSSNMNVTVVTTGKGLKLNPPLGSEWRLYTKVQGDGGLVKGGEGTLFIDDWFRYHKYETTTETLSATGVNCVNGGTLAFKPSAVHAAPQFVLGGEGCALELRGEDAELADATVGGTGTLRGGTFANLRVAATADAATEAFNVLTIDGANGAALSGRTVFDFGRAAGDPIPLFSEPKVIARWTGSKPDVSKWKAVNTGVPSAKLKLTVNDDGTIDGQVVPNGLLLIIR